MELLEKMKDAFPDKICIVMSGNPLNEKPALEAGADGFLAKPFKLRDLFEIVQLFMQGST